MGDVAIKVERDAALLPSDAVMRRLQEAGADASLALPDLDAHFVKAFTRKQISAAYGGGEVPAFCPVSRASQLENGHDYSTFLFPDVQWNPHAPQKPGQPGLYYSFSKRTWPDRTLLFVKLKPSCWVCLGEYAAVPVQNLSLEEFNAMPAKVCLHIPHMFSALIASLYRRRLSGMGGL